MKTTQITEEIDSMDETVFSQSSEIVQVGFTTDKNTLLQIAKSAECMVSDATFTIDEEGLSFREMDPSHVSLIDMGIPNSCFEKWSCIEKQSFALSIKEFRQLVSSLDAKGSVKIIIQDEKILVSQNGFSASIKTLEASNNDVPLPRIPYDSTLIFSENTSVSSLEFTKTLRKISTVSDYITINCDDNKVILSGKGDNGNSEKTYDREEIEINNRQDSETTYSFEYLMPFLKTLNKDSQIELGFSNQKPLRIQTKINNLGRVDMYLAPRVEN